MDTTYIPELPGSTFWRVSAKALIFDDKDRLLVLMDEDNEWAIPGGGWKHGEIFEHCLARELTEELRVGIVNIGDVLFCYTGKSAKGYPKISIVANVVLDDSVITPSDDGLVDYKLVTKDEFLKLRFRTSEDAVKLYAEKIWPSNR